MLRTLALVLGIILALGLALLAGMGLWGWLEARRDPVVVEVSAPLPGLPPGTRLRVLHITDTHAGNPDMPRARLERIVAQANALSPDLIVLTGDYYGGKLYDIPGVRLVDGLQPLAQLKAPLGVFAAMGNHDRPFWTPEMLQRQPSPRLLVNRHAEAGPVTVAALQSAAWGADLEATLKDIPGDRPILMLAHEPEQFVWRPVPDAGPRPALVLAGHTHGGQVRLPLIGYPADRLLGTPPCRRGFCRLNGWTVFVSSGVGTAWLPLRIAVPPEMVMLTLSAP